MIAYWTKRNDFSPTQSLGFCLISSILFNGIYNHAELQFFLKIILKNKEISKFFKPKSYGNTRNPEPEFR